MAERQAGDVGGLASLLTGLTKETSAKLEEFVRLSVKRLETLGADGSGTSETSETSESSETSETSETGEGAHLADMLAVDPGPEDWGALVAVAEAIERIATAGRTATTTVTTTVTTTLGLQPTTIGFQPTTIGRQPTTLGSQATTAGRQ